MPASVRAVDRRERQVERVGGQRGDRRLGADEPRERGAGDAHVVARRDERELRVADGDDGAERVGERGDAGAGARDGRLELLLRLLELRARRGLGLARGEDAVVLRLDLQRDVELLRDLVRFGGADVGARATDLVQPATAVEQVERRADAGGVAPGLRREIGHETALRVESVTRLVHLTHREVEATGRARRARRARWIRRCGPARAPARRRGRSAARA